MVNVRVRNTAVVHGAGLTPPTSGTISVLGHDILHDLPAARRHLGFCPQHDVLFDILTVEEHLTFFAQVSRII